MLVWPFTKVIDELTYPGPIVGILWVILLKGDDSLAGLGRIDRSVLFIQ